MSYLKSASRLNVAPSNQTSLVKVAFAKVVSSANAALLKLACCVNVALANTQREQVLRVSNTMLVYGCP